MPLVEPTGFAPQQSIACHWLNQQVSPPSKALQTTRLRQGLRCLCMGIGISEQTYIQLALRSLHGCKRQASATLQVAAAPGARAAHTAGMRSGPPVWHTAVPSCCGAVIGPAECAAAAIAAAATAAELRLMPGTIRRALLSACMGVAAGPADRSRPASQPASPCSCCCCCSYCGGGGGACWPPCSPTLSPASPAASSSSSSSLERSSATS